MIRCKKLDQRLSLIPESMQHISNVSFGKLKFILFTY